MNLEYNQIDILYNLVEEDKFHQFYETLHNISAKALLEYEPKRDNSSGNIFEFIQEKNPDYFNALFNHVISEEIKNGKKVINITPSNKWSLLMDACVNGELQKISTLVYLGVDINHQSNGVGLFKNAVHTCISNLNKRKYNTHLDILKYLIYHKADLNVVDPSRGNEITAFALHFLQTHPKKHNTTTTEVKFFKEFEEGIKILVESGVDINFKHVFGTTIGHMIFHNSQYSGHELRQLMTTLIHYGYDVTIKDDDNKTCVEKLYPVYQKKLGVEITQYGTSYRESKLLNQDLDESHSKLGKSKISQKKPLKV